eukprot:m.251570 g.251570  ORF g.251570 m.251570 type:complete len:3992 (+) comp33898_c0_seq1:283-12258(+)
MSTPPRMTKSKMQTSSMRKEVAAMKLKVPPLPPIPTKQDVHASPARRRQRSSRDESNASDETLRNATSEWNMTTALRTGRQNLVDDLAKTTQNKAITKFKPFDPKPQLPAEMESEDRKMRTQLKFLRDCATQGHVVPLADRIWEKMVDRLPEDLLVYEKVEDEPKLNRALRLTFSDLEEEVYTLYSDTIRATMVEYLTLQQDNDRLPSGEDHSTSWRLAFEDNRVELQARLRIMHPYIRAVLVVWSKYTNTMLVDVAAVLAKLPVPVDIAAFASAINDLCEETEEFLHTHWFPELLSIFSDEEKSEALSSTSTSLATSSPVSSLSEEGQAALFASANALMKIEVEQIMNQSIQNFTQCYVDPLACPRVHVSCIVNNDESDVEIVPSPLELETALLSCITKHTSSLQTFTPIDAWLAGKMKPLPVSAHHDMVQGCRKQISTVLTSRLVPVLEHLSSLASSYKGILVGGEDCVNVAKFCSEEHTFEEFCEMAEKYRALATEIRGLANLEVFDSMYVNCTPAIESLEARASALAQQLLTTLADNYTMFNMKMCKAYETIKKKSLKEPEDSGEIIAMVNYMDGVKTKELFDLKESIKSSQAQLLYLLEMHELTPTQVNYSSTAHAWPETILSSVDDSDMMMEKAKASGEDVLTRKREVLISDILKIRARITGFEDFADMGSMLTYVKEVTTVERSLAGFQSQVAGINVEETLFKWEKTSYPDIEDLKKACEPFKHLYGHIVSWQKTKSKWYDGPFQLLDGDAISDQLDDFRRETIKTQKTYAAASNMAKICNNVKNEIAVVKEHMPMVRILCNAGMRERHWKKMSEIVGMDIAPDAATTLTKQLALGLDEYLDRLETVSGQASKEFSLEKAMKKMKIEWEPMEFGMGMYRETDIRIMASVDEIQAILDDHIVKTQTMKNSPAIKPFIVEITEWEKILVDMQDSIDGWLKMQATWLYLEPIFSSKDICAQMPKEADAFFSVDGNFKMIMNHMAKDPHCLATCGLPGLLDIIIKANEDLELVIKGLNEYLEKKRLYFARFFFLSNDEMLEILSETKDPTRVQPHLKKCFEGIKSLTFTQPDLDITHMISSEKEKIELSEIVSTADARGSVEKWLLVLEGVMRRTTRDKVAEGFDSYSTKPRVDWICEQPGQVAICVGQTYWTMGMHAAIASGVEGIKAFYDKQCSEMGDIVNLVRGKIPKLVRSTCSAMVTLDVHARDVTLDLYELGVKTENDFNWLAQLRYYWEDKSGDGTYQMYAKMINSTCAYAYEYLGNSFRLVVTPLTDRCYRTLIGAYALHLGGAPEGPAGTGKTETTKDLAKAIGIQCVVFNCSDGLDYMAMGKFFKGLAASGAWSCFDEFNRITVEVLSVIAQQLLCIQRAVVADVKQFVFEGTLLDLKNTCCSFITMNPGYAGRAELPDNLKVLFRTVAMMVPNYALIAEIQLYSCGYLDARSMGYKITTTYKLCSELLSSQFHYDYGMRAVKAVLSSAANLKLKFPDSPEDELILRAIEDVNVPKFLSHDIPLFRGIISDLFPGVKQPEADYSELTEACQINCDKMGLQLTEVFLRKLIETYEMLLVRHGFMLVGDPFSGKTMVLKVLAAALTTLCEKHEEIGDNIVDGEPQYRKSDFTIINPKAITLGQLFGQFDPVSHEWTDGIVPNEFRRMATDTSPDRHWIWFDGPVDAIWIESMNTVLDDNKKLCLMSGEIIAMSGTMSMLFENRDLSQASPATVSRCGMIYLEPEQLGWKALTTSWLAALPEYVPEVVSKDFEHLFDRMLDPLLEFVLRHCTMLMEVQMMMLVNNMLRLLLASLKCFEGEANVKVLDGWSKGLLLFSITWSLGAPLDLRSRTKFNEYFRKLYSGQLEECEMDIKFPTPIPDEGQIYDYVFVSQGKGKWMKWLSTVNTELVLKKGQKLKDALVPTVDTARYMYLTDLAIKNRIPIMFVGPTGTGKSKYVAEKLMMLSKDEYAPVFLAFSAQTSATATQNFIMSKLDKRRRGIFGPRMGLVTTLFVDDFNMPQIQQYGAQPPIECLRQLLSHGYWTDLVDTTRMTIEDVLILGAMGPPGGGKNAIDVRLTRHMHVVGMTDFDDETRTRIFQAVATRGMRDNGFPMDVQALSKPIVEATLQIFSDAVVSLLPTPAKSHYTFNLRDFARVVNGFLMLPGDKASDKGKAIRLWGHEVLRVFGDRLTDDADRKWLHETMQTVVKEHFKQSHAAVFARVGKDGNQMLTVNDMDKLMFGVYVHPLDQTQPYDEAVELADFKQVATESLEEYNQVMKTPMDLVIFEYVLMHLSRICRVLKQEGGHALLVGVGGSGRQSMARLAAQILGYEIFQPEITKAYSTVEWKEDIKKVLFKAGAEDRRIVFLLNDTQIKEESFLEDVDALLNSGEVANIFEPEERAQITEKVRDRAMRATGGEVDLTPLELYNFFVGVCRDNMHLVLGMSPIGATLRTRLRQFPSLVNCCTIDWFQAWPQDALKVVAESFTESVELEDNERAVVVSLCQQFQSSVQSLALKFRATEGRTVYVTPTSYLELIKSFKDLLQAKRDEILGAKDQYVNGLGQLAFAESSVESMQKELNDLAPKLVVAKDENAKMTAHIEKETIEANAIEKVVLADEADANEKAALAQGEKEECESILAEAIPALNSALKALDTLKKSDMDEVKGMKSPPAGVRLVMEAVCVMRGVAAEKVKDPASGKSVMDFWGPAKKMLGQMSFLNDLKAYDKDNIPVKVMTRIRGDYIPNEGFVPDKIAKASKAAEGLCRWVRAMEVYDRVAKVVAPKKIALAEKMAEVEALMTMLKQKQDELASVQAKLKDLGDNLAAKTIEKEELEAKVDLCAKQLDSAQKLIKGLGGEKTRWKASADRLGEAFVNVTGDILLSAGVIAYLGPFTTLYRNECVAEWNETCKKMKLPCSDNFNLSATIGDPVKIRQWHIDGLPTDSLSIDNGTIVARGRRWPLMIDPQGQANKWVKNLERENNVKVIKLTDATFMRTLENAVAFGNPVLIENVLEELDPTLEPLLLKATYKKAGVIMIKLGENELEYSDDFRLYITTKLPNPHYLPEVATKVTLLNFMITLEGLQDQLLGIVVAKERPEVEEERQELIVTTAKNKKALKEVEVRILDTLTNSAGNILEDANAIAVLDDAKRVSDDISAKQIIADETTRKIDELRKGYEPVAAHSSVLFFVVASLADIDPMYQYSLSWFVQLYLQAIADSNKARDLPKRLRYLSDYFTYSLYTNVCRSLFEKHKLLFSFLLCSNLMKSRNALDNIEFMFLLTGGVGLENPNEMPKANWMNKRIWDEACRLSDLSGFPGFKEHLFENIDAWQKLYDSKEPQLFVEIPKPWDTKINFFQKMLVLRVIRPDKVVHAARAFVEDNLGPKFTQPPPFDLSLVYADSIPSSPLIFVLSPGADPMAALMKFGSDKGFEGDRFETISLGQGQGPIAARFIEAAREKGGWVALQNCHLATSWMGALETICEGLKPTNCHPDFRLWLTSYPDKFFPVSVLQNGAKMTLEPPDGIRMNMMQSYLNDPVSDPAFFNHFTNQNQPEKQKNFQKMLFGLTFFHAIVQERRSFGPLGWNIAYGFNESDFRISVQQLKIFFDEYDDVPYDALQYLTGQCNYGGRVTDDWDRRCLVAILMNAYDRPVVNDFKFKFSGDKHFHVPTPETYQDAIDFLQDLPVNSPPEIFGMHVNVDISKEQQQTKTLFDSVLVTVTKASGAGGDGVDVAKVAGDILEKLPQEYDLVDCLRKYPTMYEESMNTVLVQEMGRFNRLIAVMRRTLIDLAKALKGLVVMNADLDNVAVNLGIGRVPDLWMKQSYPSLKPLGSYVNDLLRRLTFLSTWYDHDKPSVFWLSGFYFTQAFLTGALQNFARKYTLAIDTLDFDFEVLKTQDHEELTEPPADGVYIYGLYVDGARWDREAHCMAESFPKVLHDSMAPMWFKPAKKAEIDTTGMYQCPVYKTSIRQGVLSTTGHSTNFVLPVQIPSKDKEDHWIRRGVALLTQLDD